jgi:hypothetical protein
MGLGAAPPTVAGAIFDGQTINYQYYYPDLLSPYSNADNGNKLGGPGIEVTNVADNRVTMDISDTNIFVGYLNTAAWNAAAFNGFVITDVFGTIPDFTSVLLNPSTNLAGLDASRISFDANHIWVNWQGLSFSSENAVSLDVEAGPAVPEPTSLVLLASGLMGLRAARNRRRPTC